MKGRFFICPPDMPRLCLQIGLLTLALLSPSLVAAWFNNTWTYRSEIDISETGGTSVSNQAISITLTADMVNPNYNWSSTGNDLRVIASDDSTLLDFYIDSWNASNKTATIWVLIPSLPANTTTTIYLYYGNQTASNLSDFVSTLTEPGLRYHTRRSTLNPSSKAEAEAEFNRLDDSVSGYGCTNLNAFDLINNHDLFGPPDRSVDIAFLSNHFFKVEPSETGIWEFQFSGDYGLGGGMYVDEIPLEEQWNDDLWWDYNWNATDEILNGSISLSAGYHSLKLIGFEDCCDGGTSVRFKRPGGNFLEWNTTNLPSLASTKCLTTPITIAAAHPDLSQSTKNFTDLNNGDIRAGDVIRYTITLNETADRVAERISITDDIPAEVSNFTVISLPAGAVNQSTTTGGNYGNGLLNISNITVTANGSATIVFEVTVNTLSPGTQINNSASIISPGGPTNLVIHAPAAIYAQGAIPGNGIKPLYLYDNSSGSIKMSRVVPSTNQNNAALNEQKSITWTLIPSLATALDIDSSAPAEIPVTLLLRATGSGNVRDIRLELSGSSSGMIASLNATTTLNGGYQLITYNLPITGATSLVAGETITFKVTNQTSGSGQRRLWIDPSNGNTHSQIQLPSNTVINVDDVTVYNDAYPNGSEISNAEPNQTIYIRSSVSDPFGSADITGATISIEDSTASTQVNTASMTAVSTTPSSKLYEYSYTIPTLPAQGLWEATITAIEGTEGTISDFDFASWSVMQLPLLTVVKNANISNGSPSETVIYQLTVTNTGNGPANNVNVKNHMTPYGALRLDSYGSNTPFSCSNGCPSSGLTLGTPTYSNNNGADFTYIPISGGGGAPSQFDANVTDWKILMNGTMNSGGSSFTIEYQMAIE